MPAFPIKNKMIKRELKILFTAIRFYTRIPVPENIGFSDDNLNKATRYLPFIGIIVGGTGAVVFLIANQWLSINISLLLCITAMILITGAFHEDALSDFCDGFGGGYSKEKILSIMKDSSIGTYGAISLIIMLLSKFVILGELEAARIPIMLVAAHSLSRLSPVFMIYTSQYVRNDSSSKSKPVGQKNSMLTLVPAIIFGILPLVFFPVSIAFVILVVLALIFIYFRYYVHKKIGGYTGDVLGALQQFSEVGFYLSYLIADKVL